MAKIYQMLWDCQFCGTQKLLAKTHRACPQCKAPQDPAWRYFPSAADKVAVESYEFKGKDKTCAACNSLNLADANFCLSCGAALDDAQTAPSVPSRERSESEQDLQKNLAIQRQMRILEEEVARGIRPKKRRQRLVKARSQTEKARSHPPLSPIEKFAVAAIGGLGCLAFSPVIIGATLITGYSVLSLWKVPAVVEVTGHRWTRTVAIETYETQSDSDWKDAVPSNARNVSCSQRQKDTKLIADGKTCTTRQVDQGDGTFREERSCSTDYRSEPIYGSYCSYDVNRWSSTGSDSVVSGNSVTDEPYWPTPTYNSCQSTQLGCQREGAKTETYTLQLINQTTGNIYRCDVLYPEWKTTPVGTQFDANIGKLVGGVDCKRMQRR